VTIKFFYVVEKSKLQLFGDRVRNQRKARGLSQEQLAELTGLHRTYIGGIERGERNVSLMNILRLAEALEVSPSDLLQGIQWITLASVFSVNVPRLICDKNWFVRKIIAPIDWSLD
jgi:transcriptional regulator with XRE-family HTH domain